MSSKAFRVMTILGLVAGVSACTQVGALTGSATGGSGTGGTGTGEDGTGAVAAADSACGAAEFQTLVGTSVGTLNAAALPANRRVIFPGMAVTQDHAPARLNVVVGKDDEIERVYCG